MPHDSVSQSVSNATEAYVRVFDHHDVEYFFNSPGSEDSSFWEHFAEESAGDTAQTSLTHVNCRHESVAVNMAKGYALVTGNPQVVKLHVNVGPLHAAMDIYGAHHASIPMVLLGSYNSTHENELAGGTSGPHYLDYQQPGGHHNNFSRYTKWLSEIETNENAERILDRAFRIGSSPPTGPVFVTVSEELLRDETKDTVELTQNSPVAPQSADPGDLDRLVEKLTTAANPLLIVGSIGRDEAARSALQTLSERLEIPVFENQKQQFNFPMDHPLYLGGSSGTAATVSQYFDLDFDLVVVLGSAKPWYPPEAGSPDAEIVVVNQGPLRTDKAYWNYPADLLLSADPGRVLSHLADAVPETDVDRPVDWKGVHDEWDRRWHEKVSEGSERTPIDPFWLCDRLDDGLPTDSIVCDETILHSSIIANTIRRRGERTYFNASRLNGGGLGSGLSLAMGAKLANPDRFTAVLIGDGSYHYNPVTASFGTAQEADLPFLTVVFNNGGYQSMQATLESAYPEGSASTTDSFVGSPISPSPDYERAMDVWDGHGETVVSPDEIDPAVDRAVEAVRNGKLALLNVVLEERPPEYPELAVADQSG